MNRDQIVELVGQRLGSRTDLNVEIVNNIQLVQATELEGCKEFLAWFLLDPEFSVTVAAGANSAALGAMIQPDDGAIFRIYPTATPSSVKEIELRERDRGVGHLLTETAEPSQISLTHDTLYLDRKADQEYTVYFGAFAREPALTATNLTNGWTNNAADWMIAEVLAIMASRVQNPKLRQEALQDAAAAKQRVWARSEAFEHAGKDYQMGVASERRRN